ncbi:orexin/Hypocretin receptor type 1-like isoform X2 [Plodia interpunctella]|uniref:orexin/Hypocretin receptor type 1-like isoform X2 n=1 Tax=Plodia interpunctella TaxID=58824 RepID=UPI0023688EE8|nr:orexin/Hypocretin receptor type 1-like [Plodia interpunctella]XP_053618100.1 orexin/Hypocretin receptor type 1-like [Plodia interpunctella]XP_053618101.1 orexin/Hypocretin receptor type 1-like [Plodia interpunctella]XP_053618102.1 orexin/Hypocretin receptor type 1-like [Plodia interpunctella]XP_053618104.1 orexin/Hypocretin receptor type 1-like [Plodia interpunctella]XP_053618105.1 orexin/Hypocretin receptor type 1-like [Plodia interpunctella]XP_053618106.1 orexin/Hypocretin receptor type 
MALKLDQIHKAVAMAFIYNLCLICDVRNENVKPNNTLNVDSHFNQMHAVNKRFSNESLIDVIDKFYNNSNEELIDIRNQSDVFGRIVNIEDITTEYGLNHTEEPCVGDPEFCNMTKEEYLDMLNEYIFPHPYEWVLIATHAIVFVIGLIGNALVCIAVYRNHSMRTVTNYFIVNLAVADFMVILICLPPTVLWDVTETWFFGTAMCRIVLYFQSVSVTVSVLTLTFISVDRWYAICFPLKFKSTTGRAKTAILIIWLLSLLFNVPEFVMLQVQRKMQLRFNVQYFMQCASTWSDDSDLNWHIIKAIFLYTFPLLLMMIAYCQIVRVLWRSDNIPGHTESHKLCATPTGQNNWLAANRRTTPSIHANASTEGQLRSRRKAAKMLVAVVAMFAVCYFPVHLLSVLRVAYDVQQSDVMTCIALISHVMCYANSAVNPLIYNFMSGKFRREFHRSYFKCFCCCLSSPTTDQNGTSFAPIGSSRAGTTRTIVRRNDSCASYRLTHLSPSNHNSMHRDYVRNSNTSFIEQMNGNRRPKIRDDSISESATRFTLTSEVGRD